MEKYDDKYDEAEKESKYREIKYVNPEHYMSDAPITLKQIQFMDKYLQSFNLEKACMESDITPKEGQEILEIPTIREIVQKELNFKFRRTQITTSRILLHVSEIATRSPLMIDKEDNPDEYELRSGFLEATVDNKEVLKASEILLKYNELSGNEDATKDIAAGIKSMGNALEIATKLAGRNK